MKGKVKHPGYLASALAFLAAYGFFQFAYPYHLVRREQMTLFVYDWDYITQTYRGAGWFARFFSDFLEQFFHLPVVGPLVVALLLTGIGAVAYRICRHFLGQWPSFGIAAAFYAWSFLRETGNLYITRYTVVMLAYLALVLLALQCRRVWQRPVAAVALVAAGAWFLGSPFHQYYGKAWDTPRLSYDRVIGLDAEVARERWDKVIRLSKKDLYMTEASYCYNLAHAMKGDLSQALFAHSQNGTAGLLIRISTSRSVFSNCMAGEAWFQVGDMTIAEQGAIIALQASPKHTGARYLVRLARVNLASGEDAAAQKYLDLLGRTLFYGKWARSVMPGRQDDATRASLAQARASLAKRDFVHHSDTPRDILTNLLAANPANRVAREYLRCYDLMNLDLDHFMEDYTQSPDPTPVYHQAALIWLSLQDRLTDADLARYGIAREELDQMGRFFRSPSRYKNTYWYYYLQATEAE